MAPGLLLHTHVARQPRVTGQFVDQIADEPGCEQVIIVQVGYEGFEERSVLGRRHNMDMGTAPRGPGVRCTPPKLAILGPAADPSLPARSQPAGRRYGRCTRLVGVPPRQGARIRPTPRLKAGDCAAISAIRDHRSHVAGEDLAADRLACTRTPRIATGRRPGCPRARQP